MTPARQETRSESHDVRLAEGIGATIPATNPHGSVSGVLISEIRDGKIAREQTFWDQMGLLQQLGVVP